MIYVALENIRSLYNVGAIFRTCSFFGIRSVILVGYTAKGITGKLHDSVTKTALGSENDLDIRQLHSSAQLIEFSKKHNLELISLEQHKKAKKFKDYKFSTGCVLVFGNEVTGVTQEVLESSKDIVEIERLGEHDSLNVTTVVGIVLEKVV